VIFEKTQQHHRQQQVYICLVDIYLAQGKKDQQAYLLLKLNPLLK
jgi:hypothetical protein